MTDHSAYYRLAKAVRLLEEDAADDMIERHSGQLELIPDGAVMVEEVQKRRGGRPKGSKNLASGQIAARIRAVMEDSPIVAFARAYARPSVKEIALRDGIPNSEAVRLKTAAMLKIAEWTDPAPPRPVLRAELGAPGDFAKLTDAELGEELQRLSAELARGKPDQDVVVIEHDDTATEDAA